MAYGGAPEIKRAPRTENTEERLMNNHAAESIEQRGEVGYGRTPDGRPLQAQIVFLCPSILIRLVLLRTATLSLFPGHTVAVNEGCTDFTVHPIKFVH